MKDEERERKVVGVGGSISSLGESEGLNDCGGADVCSSHIKQQLVCRNKLQGYWFTIHLLPSLLLPTFVRVYVRVYAGIIYYTVLVSVYVFVSFFGGSCAFVCTFRIVNSVCTLGNTPLSPVSLILPLCVCVCLCVRTWAFFQIHTVTPMCPAIDLEMTGLLTHTICSANEERQRGRETVNEMFFQSLSIRKQLRKKETNEG